MSAADRSRRARRHFLQATAAGVAALGLPAVAVHAADAPARAPKLKLGLASYSTRKYSLDDTIKIAKRVGLEYLCLKDMHLPLKSTPEQIAEARKKIDDAGLKLYGGGVISLKNQADVDQAFEYAKAAGMDRIVIMPLVETLPAIDQKVKQYDIKVCIHNHGPGDKHWPAPKDAYEKIKGLDPRIGLCIDIGHTVRIGADLVESTTLYADRVFDIHIKDVSEAAPSGKTVEVGRGVIDIPKFLATLLKIKYTGVVSFEYEIMADDVVPGLAESVGYVKGALAAL